MAEYRQDPLTKRWGIIAPGRTARPVEFVESEMVRRSGVCPFCAGNEAETTAEIDALREPGTSPSGPGWRVRAVGNKYPFLDSQLQPPVADAPGSPLFHLKPAVGPHEVLIEAPHHAVWAGELSVAETLDVLLLYRRRLQAHRASPSVRYVQIFKNVGEAAGASIEHLHSQLAALATIPETVALEFTGAGEYHTTHGRCFFCDLVAAELAASVRVVETTKRFAVVCPFASRFAYEIHLLPRSHPAAGNAADFDAVDDESLAELADLLRRTLSRVEALPGSPGYNLLLHTAPFDSFSHDHYHWHMEILPRTAKAAGFEWATGVMINPVAPESAAKVLAMSPFVP